MERRRRRAEKRPQVAPPARNGKKWPKNRFWPQRETVGKMAENGKIGPKMGQNAIFPFSHFSAIFQPFPGEAKTHFSAIFFPFRAGGPIWGLYRAIGIASRAEKRLSKRVFLESPFLLFPLKVFRTFQIFYEQTLRGQRRNGLSKNTLLDNRFSA